jgi:hypothetical protein
VIGFSTETVEVSLSHRLQPPSNSTCQPRAEVQLQALESGFRLIAVLQSSAFDQQLRSEADPARREPGLIATVGFA